MSTVSNKPVVTYKTRTGDMMQFAFGGDRVLNGKKIDLTSYQLYNGPFIQSKYNSGIIRMTDGTRVRELNFKTGSINE